MPGRNPPGAIKSERNPASSSIPSDWYPEKSPAALTKERKQTKQMASIPRGQIFKTNRAAAAMPSQQSPISMYEPLENHRTLGTYQYRAWPTCSATLFRYSLGIG